jgi:hypothetical protein
LIHSLGGALGALAGTEEGARLAGEMQSTAIGNVRRLVDRLVEGGCDAREPASRPERETAKGREVCLRLLGRVGEVQAVADELLASVRDRMARVCKAVESLRVAFVPALCRIPFKSGRFGDELRAEFDSHFESLRRFRACVDDPHFRLSAAAEVAEEDLHDPVDSDDERRLFREIDLLTEARDRTEEASAAEEGGAHRRVTDTVRRAFRQLDSLQASFHAVNSPSTRAPFLVVGPSGLSAKKSLQLMVDSWVVV